MSTHNPPPGGIPVDLCAEAPCSPPPMESTSIANSNPDQVKSLSDLALSDITLDQFPTVKAWRERLFDPEWIPEICDELPRLLTEYLRRTESEGLSPGLRRAKALKHVFSNKTPLVKKEDFLPGQTTTSFIGPVVYADTLGYCIWPELKTVSERSQNPFKIRPEVAERLNREIFPYWMDRRVVQEAARYSDYDTESFKDEIPDPVDGGRFNGHASIDPPLKKRAGQTPKCQELMERLCFYLQDKATAVSHTVPDFERVPQRPCSPDTQRHPPGGRQDEAGGGVFGRGHCSL